MTQIELIQQSIANSVETLLNAESQVIAYLEWIAEAKRRAIVAKVGEKLFMARDIISDKGWLTKGINLNAMMKVVAVSTSVSDYNIANQIKDTGSYNYVIQMSIYFLQDPGEILGSKVKLTEAERKLLKEMEKCYDNFMRENANKLNTLNRNLMDLKHGLNIMYEARWSFDLDAVLDDDFINRGVRCNNTILR